MYTGGMYTGGCILKVGLKCSVGVVKADVKSFLLHVLTGSQIFTHLTFYTFGS